VASSCLANRERWRRSSAQSVRVNACRTRVVRWLSRTPVAAPHQTGPGRKPGARGVGLVGGRRSGPLKLRRWSRRSGKGPGSGWTGRAIGPNGGCDRGRQQRIARRRTYGRTGRFALGNSPPSGGRVDSCSWHARHQPRCHSGVEMPATAIHRVRGQQGLLPHKRAGRGVYRSRTPRCCKAPPGIVVRFTGCSSVLIGCRSW
jgi:hypothetical protein